MRTVSTIFTVVGQFPAQRPGLEPYLPNAIGARTIGLTPLLQGGGKSVVGVSGSGFIAHILFSGYVPSVM
jgi:hypothetical protein